MSDEGLEAPKSESRICPTCGTKNSEHAQRCVVCATELRAADTKLSTSRTQITLSLPLAIVLLAAFALLSAGLTFAATRAMVVGEQVTPTATITITPTLTLTSAPTFTQPPEPTFTALPPIEYTIADGDTCAGLAFFYDVSVRSLIELNNLGVECLLAVGTRIMIPQPTPTATALPTATLSAAEATDAACEKVSYTVKADDVLSAIAENYVVSMQGIKEYNGMVSDIVFEGQLLIIPLCERINFGPTATPTLPPPHPAPNLLLPQDGAPFSLADETVSLQWASVGQLRENEYYQVIVEDITEGSGRRRIEEYVTDTKFIVPRSFRPNEANAHVMRWWITSVRLVGTTASGEAQYQNAGSASARRSFTWSGATPQFTPTP
ncbi:MAG: LysM peptidoglycan-binding domain-containing protein [Chloroflexi bacterium]|nr:LysM peptidoglycan-binding domain-containing protein [Chloroflexota bacterium]